MVFVGAVMAWDSDAAHAFDCLRPNVQQDFGLCLDITKLSPLVDTSPVVEHGKTPFRSSSRIRT